MSPSLFGKAAVIRLPNSTGKITFPITIAFANAVLVTCVMKRESTVW